MLDSTLGKSLCTSRSRYCGPQALLPRGRGPIEANHCPAARFSFVVVPIPRPHSASGGSVSRHRARLWLQALEDRRTPATFTVNNTSDSGAGSLNQAILDANAAAGADSIVVTGCTTSGCVRGTVVDGFSYNFRALVPYDAVYDRSATSHAVNLFDMAWKYADVLSPDEALDALGGLKAAA